MSKMPSFNEYIEIKLFLCMPTPIILITRFEGGKE